MKTRSSLGVSMLAAVLAVACENKAEETRPGTDVPKSLVELDLDWTIAGATPDGTRCEGGALTTSFRLLPRDGGAPIEETPTCAAGSLVVRVAPGTYDVTGHLARGSVTGPEATGSVIVTGGAAKPARVVLDLLPPGATVDAGGACSGAKVDFAAALTPAAATGSSMCGKTYAQGLVGEVRIHDHAHGPPLSNVPNNTACGAAIADTPAPKHLDMSGGEIEIPLASVSCKPTKLVVGLDFTYGSGPPYPSTLERLASYKGTTVLTEVAPDAHAPTASLDIPADAEVVVLQRPNLGSSDVTHVLWIELQ